MEIEALDRAALMDRVCSASLAPPLSEAAGLYDWGLLSEFFSSGVQMYSMTLSLPPVRIRNFIASVRAQVSPSSRDRRGLVCRACGAKNCA